MKTSRGQLGSPGSPGLDAQGGQPADSDFADKATGDWGGERERLKQAGITIEATFLTEGFYNFRGGIRTWPPVGSSTSDVSLGLDMEKLCGWNGGKFYADLEDHAWRNPTKTLTGDLQIFDKQNTAPYLQVFELWYQQKLFNGMLRLKVGKVDANTEFSVVDNGLSFLNSSSQVSPTVFVFPTTPDPMPSVNVFFTPPGLFYAGFGAYYANRSDRFGELVDNPADAQLSEFGAFLIGETGLKWENAPVLANAGNLKVGFWEHTGTFTRFEGAKQQGTSGGYGIIDQTLWQPAGEAPGGRGVRAFLEYGRTQQTITPVYQHIGGGLTWQGLCDCRPDDTVGVSPQYAYLSPGAGLPYTYELALEAFYKLQVTRWATLRPDLQYIVHPGGKYPDALVGTIGVRLDF
ncbi:MAG: carbohydrate porin [Syntrophobacteraceae bacterium]|nr:carbohydrate porin [Syntrophobacteraceae bacterium]